VTDTCGYALLVQKAAGAALVILALVRSKSPTGDIVDIWFG
jgi:hypothetical protein